MGQGRITELDGLRALAVGGVIAFHYCNGSPLQNRVAALGWIGVDLFFVLSGFLITRILLGSRGQPQYFQSFYARRTLRIFPVYYLALTVYVVSAWLGGGSQPWSYWLMHGAFLSATAEFFHYWRFAAPVFVYGGVTVLWSLSIEEQFYLIWAPVVRWVNRPGLWVILISVVIAAPCLRLAVHQAWFPEYHFFPTRMDSLAWGAMLALAQRQLTSRKLAQIGTVAAAIWLGLVVATGGERSNLAFATLGYTLLAIGFAALVGWIVDHAGSAEVLCRGLRMRPLVYVGTISYALYLVHYPTLLLIGGVWGRWVGSGVWASAGRDAVSLAVSLALAGLSWRYLERPILQVRNRMTEPKATEIRIREVVA